MRGDGESYLEASLAARYAHTRSQSRALAAPLSAEDMILQSMPDASPTKWHLAHTTWFFETFLLTPYAPGYRPFDPAFRYLFNSYYDTVGARHPRAQRGMISRPSCNEVLAYRAHVDAAMDDWLAAKSPSAEARDLLALGLAHEEQHQELILMDIKHALSANPLRPAYVAAGPKAAASKTSAMSWVALDEGLRMIGDASGGFAFDNEGPAHRVWLDRFELADRLVTGGEWEAFIADGGYDQPRFWLSDGWAVRQREGWTAPLYWAGGPSDRSIFTLQGERDLDLAEPVCHVSFYEADAFAAWAGARLPTEAEWEAASGRASAPGAFVEDRHLHPAAAGAPGGLRQMFGDVWEWTRSAYTPYPGFRAAEGAVGEYNGKFMSGQQVLRGGCAVTPRDHVRATYRNFFPPQARWAFAGVRLARDPARTSGVA